MILALFFYFYECCAWLTLISSQSKRQGKALVICLFFSWQLGPVEGVFFADYGTDLGSGSTVPGMFVCVCDFLIHYLGCWFCLYGYVICAKTD